MKQKTKMTLMRELRIEHDFLVVFDLNHHLSKRQKPDSIV